MRSNTIHPLASQQVRTSVNYHFDVNIDNPTRTRDHVNGRMTFAYFMRKKGYSYMRIGQMLGKDHATIIHYIKNIEWYMKTDVDFREKFNLVYEDCYVEDNTIHLLNDNELIKEVFSLRKEIKSLHSQIDSLKLEQLETKKESNRLRPILDVVRQRTRSGTEEEVLKKLNTLYNGIV